MTESLRVGTRRSPLARAQTAWVVGLLERSSPGIRYRLRPIDTSGDRDRSIGSSPDFTDAIDRALSRGEIDLAVHSAKDLPVVLDPRFQLAACPPRADPRDCLVLTRHARVRGLPRGARVGSSSLRRRAQLLRWRPDLDIVEIRGNVDSRIAKVRSGEIDAAILAVAGISRLRRTAEIDRILPSSGFLPAPAQGALAVVSRSDDPRVTAKLRWVNHAATMARVVAERSFAAALGGDCSVPLGALGTVRNGRISLIGEVLSPDGRRRIRAHRAGPWTEPAAVGSRLGERLLREGAGRLLARRPR